MNKNLLNSFGFRQVKAQDWSFWSIPWILSSCSAVCALRSLHYYAIRLFFLSLTHLISFSFLSINNSGYFWLLGIYTLATDVIYSWSIIWPSERVSLFFICCLYICIVAKNNVFSSFAHWPSLLLCVLKHRAVGRWVTLKYRRYNTNVDFSRCDVLQPLSFLLQLVSFLNIHIVIQIFMIRRVYMLFGFCEDCCTVI